MNVTSWDRDRLIIIITVVNSHTYLTLTGKKKESRHFRKAEKILNPRIVEQKSNYVNKNNDLIFFVKFICDCFISKEYFAVI